MTTDAALVTLAGAGDDTSYEELRDRHVLAAWGLAQAITRDDVTALAAVERGITGVFAAIDRGGYPAGLPVRLAILAATRAAAQALLHHSPWTGSPQRRDLVDRSFSGLPECWRSALWLTEVERLRPVEAARPLRVTPDDAAVLAERARAGFADRYLRVASAGRSEPCRRVLPMLVGARSGWLRPAHTAEVDQHLAACRPCRRSSVDLGDLGATLRRTMLPTPVLTAGRRPVAAAARGRYIPAVAALVTAVLGLATLTASFEVQPNPAEQAASPIEVMVSAREPDAIRSLAMPVAAPTDPGDEASSLPPAGVGASHDDPTVVATAAAPAVVPAVQAPPPSARSASAPAAPVESQHGPEPAPPPPGNGAPEGPTGAEPESATPTPSEEEREVLAVAAAVDVGEAADAAVDIGVAPASPEPVELDVTITALSTGL